MLVCWYLKYIYDTIDRRNHVLVVNNKINKQEVYDLFMTCMHPASCIADRRSHNQLLL